MIQAVEITSVQWPGLDDVAEIKAISSHQIGVRWRGQSWMKLELGAWSATSGRMTLSEQEPDFRLLMLALDHFFVHFPRYQSIWLPLSGVAGMIFASQSDSDGLSFAIDRGEFYQMPMLWVAEKKQGNLYQRFSPEQGELVSVEAQGNLLQLKIDNGLIGNFCIRSSEDGTLTVNCDYLSPFRAVGTALQGCASALVHAIFLLFPNVMKLQGSFLTLLESHCGHSTAATCRARKRFFAECYW